MIPRPRRLRVPRHQRAFSGRETAARVFRFGSPHESCGVRALRRATPCTSTCGTTTLKGSDQRRSPIDYPSCRDYRVTKTGRSSPSHGRHRPSRWRSRFQSKAITPGKSGPPRWRINSRLPQNAVNPTTVLATTNTGWPRWRVWCRRKGWPIHARSKREKKPGPRPTETRLTVGLSSCFDPRTPDARWLLVGSRARSRRTGCFSKSDCGPRLDSPRAPVLACCSACVTRSSPIISLLYQPS